jgi:hypothetical protein
MQKIEVIKSSQFAQVDCQSVNQIIVKISLKVCSLKPQIADRGQRDTCEQRLGQLII